MLFWNSVCNFDPCIFLLPSLLEIHLFIFSINNRTVNMRPTTIWRVSSNSFKWSECAALVPWTSYVFLYVWRLFASPESPKLSECKEKKINVKISQWELGWIMFNMSFARILSLTESSGSHDIRTIMNQFPMIGITIF